MTSIVGITLVLTGLAYICNYVAEQQVTNKPMAVIVLGQCLVFVFAGATLG